MIIVKSSKLKVITAIGGIPSKGGKSYSLKFKVINFGLIIATLHFALCTLHSPILAISPTPTLAQKTTVTPISSPSARLTPTTIEDEKVKELRDSLTATGIQEKLNQIKDKIEKRAYVGTILEITDSTLTLSSFRGKQRVRLTEETTIIGTNKKEITTKDLAVEDKIITMGEVDTNGTLEAKRVVVVAPLKTIPPKRLVFFGTITEIDSKASTVTLTAIKNLDQTVTLKIDKNTDLADPKDAKVIIKLKDLKENQKILAIYPEPAEGKPAIAKTIFLLP